MKMVKSKDQVVRSVNKPADNAFFVFNNSVLPLGCNHRGSKTNKQHFLVGQDKPLTRYRPLNMCKAKPLM